MVSENTQRVIEDAKALYDRELRDRLESENRHDYVAIEPESGDYFLADTFDAAVKAARAKHPTRLTHTIHIGHRAAFSLGLAEI